MGPRTGIGRHRRAAGHRLGEHQPEGVGAAREHEHVGALVVRRELRALLRADEDRVGKAPLELLARRGHRPRRACVPGRSSSRNAGRFFSTATRPTNRNTGRAQVGEAVRSSGWKSSVSTPRDQSAMLREAALLEQLADRRRGHQDRRRAPVEAPQPGVGDAERHAEARLHVLGKAGVVRRGEMRGCCARSRRARRRPAGLRSRCGSRPGRTIADALAPPRARAAAPAGSRDRWASGIVRKPSGESTWTSWPQRSSQRTVFVSVTTTPLTCGAQASVTRRIRKSFALLSDGRVPSPQRLDGLPVDDPQLARFRAPPARSGSRPSRRRCSRGCRRCRGSPALWMCPQTTPSKPRLRASCGERLLEVGRCSSPRSSRDA